MVTLIYSSLLSENMPKGSSCASVEEKDVIYLNFTAAYWAGTCLLEVLVQSTEVKRNGISRTLIYRSLLSGNVSTGRSWATDWGTDKCDLLNSQKVTERKHAYWKFVGSQLRDKEMWLTSLTAAYWAETCVLEVLEQLSNKGILLA